MSNLLLITEKALPSLGILQLLADSKAPQIYCIQLDLDTYQSNAQRDWLALRWQEKTLYESVLVPTANDALRVSKLFKAQSKESAIEFLNVWVDDLRAALERVKLSRV